MSGAESSVDKSLAASIKELISKSLGDPEAYEVARNKSKLLALASSKDLPVPQTLTVQNEAELATAMKQLGDGLFIKADGTFGGQGVRAVSTLPEAAAYFAAWRKPPSLKTMVLSCLREKSIAPFMMWRNFTQPDITLQRGISGIPANRAVVCEKGKVIAGLTVKAARTMKNNGPATVIETSRHAQIKHDVDVMVAELGLSGFVGFDFMVDENNAAWMLELNPRVTPASCLYDPKVAPLAGALRAHMDNSDSTTDDPPDGQNVVLFPQELARDKNSELLSTPEHFVPWNEPDYVLACLKDATIRTGFERVRSLFVRDTPPTA